MIENSISESLFPRFLFHIDSLCLPPHSVSHRYISLLFSPPSHSPRRHILALSPLPYPLDPPLLRSLSPPLSPLALSHSPLSFALSPDTLSRRSPNHIALSPLALPITKLSQLALSPSLALPLLSQSHCSPNQIALPITSLALPSLSSHGSLSPRFPNNIALSPRYLPSVSPLALSPLALSPLTALPSLIQSHRSLSPRPVSNHTLSPIGIYLSCSPPPLPLSPSPYPRSLSLALPLPSRPILSIHLSYALSPSFSHAISHLALSPLLSHSTFSLSLSLSLITLSLDFCHIALSPRSRSL